MLIDVPDDPFEWWAESGGAWLTGRADGPCLYPTGDVGSFAFRNLRAVDPAASARDAADLLFGRAAFTHAHRDGTVATGGTARMLRTGDRWVAVNLARPTDLSAVAAIIQDDDGGDPFAALASFAATSPSAVLVERCQLFGVPASAVGAAPARAPRRVKVGASKLRDSLRVADLTSLWAGPTCARLLAGAGAHVVKVESTERPDGARRGHAGFYAWLHARDAESVSYPFTTEDGRRALRREIDRADVVLEASRPRALRQLGIVAEEWLAGRPGRVWLSITGYGRDDAEPGRVAFGDDAAAAGGLVAFEPGDQTPLFVGDAIADPLTGLAGARALVESLASGGGELIDVSLSGVAASVVGDFPASPRGVVAGARPPQLPNTDI